MPKQIITNNDEVTIFLQGLDHPLKKEIEQLRQDVLSANSGITENIKWNGPNFCFRGEDRITMRIQPPKQIQLIFHRGSKVLEQPKAKLITDSSGFLAWRANDRAVATFKSLEEIKAKRSALTKIVNEWLDAASK